MTVYVDGLRWWGMKIRGREVKSCHLTADTIQELNDMADAIGAKPHWIHSDPSPHYDLTASLRDKAIECGATIRRRTPKGGGK